MKHLSAQTWPLVAAAGIFWILVGSVGRADEPGALPAAWQQQHFGTTDVDPKADPDGDGKSNWEEFVNGTDPLDYYNGTPPSLSVVGGRGQNGTPGTTLPQPVTVLVDSYGAYNAPLTFTVISGKALLKPQKEGGPAPTASLEVRSTERAPDEEGHTSYVAQVYVVMPATVEDDNTIESTAHSGKKAASVSVKVAVADPALPSPTNFRVTASTATTAQVSWTPGDASRSTIVEVSGDQGRNWRAVGTIAPGITSCTLYQFKPDQKEPVLLRARTGPKAALEPGSAPSPGNTSR